MTSPESESADLRERVQKLTTEVKQLRKDSAGNGRRVRQMQEEFDQKVRDCDTLEQEARAKDELAEERQKKLADATLQVRRLERLQRPRGPGSDAPVSGASAEGEGSKDQEVTELRKKLAVEVASRDSTAAKARRDAAQELEAKHQEVAELRRKLAVEVASRGDGLADARRDATRELDAKQQLVAELRKKLAVELASRDDALVSARRDGALDARVQAERRTELELSRLSTRVKELEAQVVTKDRENERAKIQGLKDKEVVSDASQILEQRTEELRKKEAECRHLQQVVQQQTDRMVQRQPHTMPQDVAAGATTNVLKQSVDARAEAQSARVQAESARLAAERMELRLAELQHGLDAESALRQRAQGEVESLSRRLASREATISNLEEKLIAQAGNPAARSHPLLADALAAPCLTRLRPESAGACGPEDREGLKTRTFQELMQTLRSA